MCDAAARRPPDGAPALQHHERLTVGGAAGDVVEPATVAHRLDVRQADRGGGVVGEVVEVVGHAGGGGVAGRHRPADAHAGVDREVQEAREEVARLADDADAARRWVRRHDLRAQRHRRRHHALPVGAGEDHAVRGRDRHQLGLRRARRPLPPRRSPRWRRTRPSRPGARTRRAAPGSPTAACTRTRGRRRRRAGRRPRWRRGARGPHRLRGSPGRRGPCSRTTGCCAASRTRTCRDARTRPPR